MATNLFGEEPERLQAETADNLLVIRLMTEADLPAVAELERECFSTPWSERSFQLVLANPVAYSLVADVEGQLCGYVIFGWHGTDFLVANLAVGTAYRRRRIAVRLMEAAIRVGRESGADGAILDVRESNQTAFLLYRNLGFRVIGRRKRYYSCPEEDSLVMRLDFRPEGQSN